MIRLICGMRFSRSRTNDLRKIDYRQQTSNEIILNFERFITEYRSRMIRSIYEMWSSRSRTNGLKKFIIVYENWFIFFSIVTSEYHSRKISSIFQMWFNRSRKNYTIFQIFYPIPIQHFSWIYLSNQLIVRDHTLAINSSKSFTKLIIIPSENLVENNFFKIKISAIVFERFYGKKSVIRQYETTSP